MSDAQKFNGGDYVNKARDAARGNPDKARSAIDKVQEAADRRTGGKFASIIDKAGDFVEDKLGLPQDTAADKPTSEGESAPRADAEDKGAPTPPRPDAGQSGSTGSGALPG